METEFTRKERNLSGAETVIMKAIWDHTGDGKKLSVPELITLLNEEYGRPYAKTTVVTFLLHLSDKRFVTTYREGRYSYVQPTKTEQAYKESLLLQFCDLWHGGNTVEMVRGFFQAKKPTKEQMEEIRGMLDQLA